jgi:uncharacterized protein RhaS with RHS repeats
MENKQLNALGAFEDLDLFDSLGNRIYQFNAHSHGCWGKYTYDSNGKRLTYEDSYGNWNKSTYDLNGNQLTFEDSNGNWDKSTYDSNGNEVFSENQDGCWWKRTYDTNGNELTFENSNGRKRGFDIPEFTMEELVKKIGHNFKIKK